MGPPGFWGMFVGVGPLHPVTRSRQTFRLIPGPEPFPVPLAREAWTGPLCRVSLTPHRVEPQASDVTRLLASISAGDPAGMERLMPLVYDELKGLAASQLRREVLPGVLVADRALHRIVLQ